MDYPDVPDDLRAPPGQPWDVGGEPEWFVDTLEDRPGDRLSFALFSGGDDSLASTHYCMERGLTDAVLYLCTNTGLAENTDYVIETCREFGWPLLIYPAPMSLVRFAMIYGFPGAAFHSIVYIYLKERQLQYLATSKEGKPRYYTGVRKGESDRRAKNIADDEVVEDHRWYWHAPIRDWEDDDVVKYRERRDLPRNPIAAKIHRSGDCYCGAYAHRDELLIDLRAESYDAHADWLLAVEEEVQAYRGRVDQFKADNPDAFEVIEKYRDRFSPKPMRLPTARELYPVEAAFVDELPREQAVDRGRHDARNFWGHSDLTDNEISALLADHDDRQFSLCQFCGE